MIRLCRSHRVEEYRCVKCAIRHPTRRAHRYTMSVQELAVVHQKLPSEVYLRSGSWADLLAHLHDEVRRVYSRMITNWDCGTAVEKRVDLGHGEASLLETMSDASVRLLAAAIYVHSFQIVLCPSRQGAPWRERPVPDAYLERVVKDALEAVNLLRAIDHAIWGEYPGRDRWIPPEHLPRSSDDWQRLTVPVQSKQ